MSKTSNLFQTTILVLILAPGLLANAHFVLAQGNGTATTGGRSGFEPGHASDLILDLGNKDAAETTGHLSLPNDATAVGATVTVIPGPGAASPAAGDDDGTVHPDGPRVDVGADGTDEWAFDGVGYGEAGHQTTFGDGSGGAQFGPSEDRSWTITTDTHTGDTIILPKDARVDSASLLLQPVLRNDWWNNSWQRRLPIEIESGDHDLLPTRVEREVGLVGNLRDPASELRLTMVEGATEVPHPFWVVSSSWSSATVGFDVPLTKEGETTRFYLYYDNPERPIQASVPRPQTPIVAVFEDETVLVGSGPLKNPVGLAQAADGSLLVADMGNSRVLVTDTVGNVKKAISVECPYDVATDAKGHIAVADPGGSQVLVFRSDGTYERALGVGGSPGSDGSHLNGPWSVAFDADGRVYISDNGNERVQVFDGTDSTTATWTYGSTGQYGWDSSHLDSPRGITVSNGLYVADAYNARVQHFTALGDRHAHRSLGIDRLGTPTDVAVSEDRIFISDTGKVLELDRDGYYVGEWAGLSWPGGLAVGPWGDLWISETGADRVLRMVDAKLEVGDQEGLYAPRDLELMLGGTTLRTVDGLLKGPMVVDVKTGIVKALENARCALDGYGNEQCRLVLSVRGQAPGPDARLIINGLDIQYSFSTRMSVALAAGTSVDEGGERYLPVKASSRNGGRILLKGFFPSLDRPPFPLPLGWEPTVPEGTNGSAVLWMAQLFSDEGDLTYDIGIIDGPEGARAWVDDNGTLVVDLSASPNVTRGLILWAKATDTLGQSTEIELDVVVDDLPDAPFVPEGQTYDARCGQTFEANISADDGDGDDLQFMLLDGPEGLAINRDGAMDWRPTSARTGPNTVSILVTDGLFDIQSIVIVNVVCVDHPPTVTVDGVPAVRVGELSVIHLGIDDQDGDDVYVELRGAPKGMRYDAALGAVLWTPGVDDVGQCSVVIVASDGILRALVPIHITVQGPRPWAKVSLGVRQVEGDRLLFSGEAGGIGRISRVEARVDNGPWVKVDGTAHWTAKVDTEGMTPGRHRLEARSFDGSYSDVAFAAFDVPLASGGGSTVALWPTGPYLAALIVIVLVIGGAFMLKSYGGTVFSVQRGPDGPTICVPVGTRGETAGHCVADEGPDEVPDQPPRNVRCYVCLGRLKSAEDYLECPNCGRVYHKACASRIKACPICGADLVKDEIKGGS